MNQKVWRLPKLVTGIFMSVATLFGAAAGAQTTEIDKSANAVKLADCVAKSYEVKYMVSLSADVRKAPSTSGQDNALIEKQPVVERLIQETQEDMRTCLNEITGIPLSEIPPVPQDSQDAQSFGNFLNAYADRETYMNTISSRMAEFNKQILTLADQLDALDRALENATKKQIERQKQSPSP